MNEGLWKLLEKFTPDAHQAALKECEENEFDPEACDVPLNESYQNLLSSCNTLKGAIERNYYQKLPLTIQKEIEGLVAQIATDHDELLAGQDKVAELAETIESLYTAIWRYRLNQLSGEEIGYTHKIDQLKQIEASISEKQAIVEKALTSKEELDQLLSSFTAHEKAVQQQLQAATDASEACASKLTEIEANSQEAVTALTSINTTKSAADEDLEAIQENKKLASDDETAINKMVADFTALTDELTKNKATQHELFGEFENYRKKIDGLLADANRAGLAGSFTNRRLWLLAPLAGWLLVFGFSIYELWSIGKEHILPILEGNKPILWEQLPLRLALTAPLVWLGWFSARQYGFTSRLREDYAYKEASSKSFEGFKREAKEIDAEMLKKLLEQAIKNLGDNPIRIYDGKNNHQTPTQELIENLLSNEKFKKLIGDKAGKAGE